jgi:hypothetical protein
VLAVLASRLPPRSALPTQPQATLIPMGSAARRSLLREDL